MPNINESSVNRMTNYTNDTTTTAGFAGLVSFINGAHSTTSGSRLTNLELYEFMRELYNAGVVSGTVTVSGGTITSASFTGS